MSIEATEDSRDDMRARTWGDLEVGHDPDRRSWGILTGFFLASACAIFRVALIAGSVRENGSLPINRRIDFTYRQVLGAAG